MAPQSRPASASARSTTGPIARRWSREAISGTTPPVSRWTSSCEATTFDSTSRPSTTIAAAVSSHEVSMPRTRAIGELYACAGAGRVERHGRVTTPGSRVQHGSGRAKRWYNRTSVLHGCGAWCEGFMKLGLLWYDADPRLTREARLADAASRF